MSPSMTSRAVRPAVFERLIPLLADCYHIVAPDYPGFGLSDAQPPAQYAYT